MTEKGNRYQTALRVNKGIEQPSSVNPEAHGKYKQAKSGLLSADEYLEGIISGNRPILGKAITIIESSHEKHQGLAREIVEKCLPYSGKSIRIGITGVPGVGKSTFIESLGKLLLAEGKKLAVLAIDPSSSRGKGSILGDKTRMETLASDSNAFIRPSPSGGTLGGVARKTRESLILCEAAGYNILFVETVGVGQSETAVHSMTDFFLLLMLAGAGDELQGIKRGIMEMADAIVINKADGDNENKARLAAREYENALHLFPPAASGWAPKVATCSSTTGTGIAEVWKIIGEYHQLALKNGYFTENRNRQELSIFFETIKEGLSISFFSNNKINSMLEPMKIQVLSGKLSPYRAAQKLLDVFMKG
ncbi:MAG: methylmalonyl Co-A mutase-associated GTPase MeaB [Bacteroidales bacterium]|nr:methylmalonyl Co-A mutase-associated GTPase MeaB [Bacteroidales bacterium]